MPLSSSGCGSVVLGGAPLATLLSFGDFTKLLLLDTLLLLNYPVFYLLDVLDIPDFRDLSRAGDILPSFYSP